jgi:hypothetical protein
MTRTPLYPVMTRILLLEAIAQKANLPLLERTDLRELSIEYRLAREGREETFLTSVRCVERFLVDGEFTEWRTFKVPTAIGGELAADLAEPRVSAEIVPPRSLCALAKRLPTGAMNTLVYDLNRGTVLVSAIDRTKAPPLVATFNLGKDPLTLRGITAYPPVIKSVEDKGRVTRDELFSYAPPFRTERDRGVEIPSAVKELREKDLHSPRGSVRSAEFVTTSSWCASRREAIPFDSACMQ